jgi:hypothetical protein
MKNNSYIVVFRVLKVKMVWVGMISGRGRQTAGLQESLIMCVILDTILDLKEGHAGYTAVCYRKIILPISF